jgi:hypothetical protein
VAGFIAAKDTGPYGAAAGAVAGRITGTYAGIAGGLTIGKELGDDWCPKQESAKPGTPTSFVDPDTGEVITNKDGKTYAGAPTDKGEYIGEADDVNFNAQYVGEADDPKFVNGGDDSSKPDPKDNMPADDGSGPSGPRSDLYMPTDDGSGAVGPRAYIGGYAGAQSIQMIALSRLQLT